MNVKPLLFSLLAASTAFAADPPARYDSTAIVPPIPLNGESAWRPLLASKPEFQPITLGKSDFVISGPLIEGFRRSPRSENLSLRQKFLRLPVIRMVVPQPMEQPPGTGKYFAWRNVDCTAPWPAAASRPDLMKGPGPVR